MSAREARPPDPGKPGRLLYAARTARSLPFAIALAVYSLAFAVMRPRATGDEPHYLLAAQSLLRDGDFDLRNDYASAERVRGVYAFFPLVSHAAPTGYPGHNVGLSAFVAPAYWLGGTVAARVLVILTTALLADQLFRLLERLAPGSAQARWLAWAGVALTLPLVAFSNQFYPETLGALLTVVGVRVLADPVRSRRTLATGALAAALLPWLHVRFVPIAVALITLLAWSEIARALHGRRFALAPVARAARSRLHTLAALGAPLAGSLAVMAFLHERWYGDPSPGAPLSTKSEALKIGAGGWDFIFEDVAGPLLNPSAGLIPPAPVYALAIAATGCFVHLYGRKALAAAGLVLAYLLLIGSIGIGDTGFTFPGRFFIVVAPLAVVPLAVVIGRVRVARSVYLALLALSLAFACMGVLREELLYPTAVPGKTDLPLLRVAQGIFPNTRPPPAPITVYAPAASTLRLTGTLQEGAAVASVRAGDERGYLLYGTYTPLRRGVYRAVFSLDATSSVAGAPIARLEIASAWGILADRTLSAAELQREPNVVLGFGAPGGGVVVEPRVYYTGTGTLWAYEVAVEPAGTLAPEARVRDWPLVALWLVVLVLAGWLLLGLMRASRAPLPDLDARSAAWALVAGGLGVTAVGVWPELAGYADQPGFGLRQALAVAVGATAVATGLTLVATRFRRSSGARAFD